MIDLTMITAQAIGLVGAACLFIGHWRRKILSESKYAIINMVGAFVLAASSLWLGALAPGALNIFWFFVAVRDYRNASGSVPSPPS